MKDALNDSTFALAAMGSQKKSSCSQERKPVTVDLKNQKKVVFDLGGMIAKYLNPNIKQAMSDPNFRISDTFEPEEKLFDELKIDFKK